MPDPETVDISRAEIREGMLPSVEAFLGQKEEYTAITAAASESIMETNHAETAYMPAVKFIMDSTLGIMTQPGIEERLPREVARRLGAAVHYGNFVIEAAVKSGMFKLFYEHNIDLLPIAKSILKELTDPKDMEYISSLGLAPVFDTSVVSGGALRFLQERDLAGDDPASIIARSRRLLVISGIERGNSRKAFAYLGRPYAAAEHFELVPDREDTTLAFTEETSAFLRSLGDGAGCPSAKQATLHDPNLTLLEDSWRRTVSYLVPPDATALETAMI